MQSPQRLGILIGEHRHHIQCRFCLQETLTPFIDFGYVPLAGGFFKKGSTDQDFQSEPRYPLKICFCRHCGLVQVNNAIPGDVLFRDYFYFSSAIGTLAEHFARYAEELAHQYPDPSKVTVVELGCNDGVLLKPLRSQGFKAIGVDPATNVVQALIETGYTVINDYFGERVAQQIVGSHGQADVFLSSNSFAHIDDMHDVMRGVKMLLRPDGYLAFENHYLPKLIQEMQYDMMYHEHLNYYSLQAVTNFLDLFDMEVFDVKDIPIHGGSVRFCAQHKGAGGRRVSERVHHMRQFEREFGADRMETYTDFARKVERVKNDLIALLDNLKGQGKRIIGYGASGRATQLSAYCGIGRQYLDGVVDDAPAKQGAFTPGNHLPIIDSSILNTPDRPDYALLFAWAFAEEIRKRNRAYLERGGRFIVPLPEVSILGV
jgi:SAM-dependent methyltransferase